MQDKIKTASTSFILSGRNHLSWWKHNAGISLVEIIISMALVAIIAVAFLPLYVTSAKVVSRSENKLEATHTGKDVMEMIYGLSQNHSSYDSFAIDVHDKIGNDPRYTEVTIDTLYKTADDKHFTINLSSHGNLAKAIVKVYSDATRTTLDSQYEANYVLN